MEEITIQTDEEVGAEAIHIGTDPITGLEMFRRYRILLSDTYTKQHAIHYEEWLLAKDQKVYKELYKQKHYLVVDIEAVLYKKGEIMENEQLAEGGEIKKEADEKYTKWFNQLKPILLPAINETLALIPLNAPSGYTTT